MNTPIEASLVLTTRDLNVRPERDVAEIVSRFLTTAEAAIAHWVEYSKGLLLFVTVPGDARSGEFYIYDRRAGSFWLLALPDTTFGGYAPAEMRGKIRDFRLYEYAENPDRLRRKRKIGHGAN